LDFALVATGLASSTLSSTNDAAPAAASKRAQRGQQFLDTRGRGRSDLRANAAIASRKFCCPPRSRLQFQQAYGQQPLQSRHRKHVLPVVRICIYESAACCPTQGLLALSSCTVSTNDCARFAASCSRKPARAPPIARSVGSVPTTTRRCARSSFRTCGQAPARMFAWTALRRKSLIALPASIKACIDLEYSCSRKFRTGSLV